MKIVNSNKIVKEISQAADFHDADVQYGLDIALDIIDKSKEFEDVTDEYTDVLGSFSADFELALDRDVPLDRLQKLIDEKDRFLLSDIELLSRLDFDLRHHKLRIIKVSDERGKENNER